MVNKNKIHKKDLLCSQLFELYKIAYREGLYDAAEFLLTITGNKYSECIFDGVDHEYVKISCRFIPGSG